MTAEWPRQLGIAHFTHDCLESSWTLCGKLSFECLRTSYFPKAKFCVLEEVQEAQIWLIMKMAECMVILF